MNVCIIGNDATGKSTIARLLVEQHKQTGIDSNIHVVSFATPLKAIFREHGLPVDSKPYSDNLRNLLRYMGDAMRDTYGEDYWVKALLNTLPNAAATSLLTKVDDSFIVDDMRYWSEFRGWMTRFPDSKIIVVGHPEMHSVAEQRNMPRSVVEVNELMFTLLNADVYRKQLIHLTGTEEQNRAYLATML